MSRSIVVIVLEPKEVEFIRSVFAHRIHLKGFAFIFAEGFREGLKGGDLRLKAVILRHIDADRLALPGSDIRDGIFSITVPVSDPADFEESAIVNAHTISSITFSLFRQYYFELFFTPRFPLTCFEPKYCASVRFCHVEVRGNELCRLRGVGENQSIAVRLVSVEVDEVVLPKWGH